MRGGEGRGREVKCGKGKCKGNLGWGMRGNYGVK